MMVPIMCAIATGGAANSRSAAGIARLFHVPAAAGAAPLLGSEGQRVQHALGAVNGALTVQPLR
jgi:hypothetical protein